MVLFGTMYNMHVLGKVELTEWVDAATTFLDATVWGEQGERAAS